MEYTFIINPHAGRGRARVAWNVIEQELRHLGVAYEGLMTAGPGDGARLARERAGGTSVVVAVGGDGTLHEVGNGVVQHAEKSGVSPRLGWIPTGTGNDFARTFQIPVLPRRALALILAGSSRAIDVGRVGERSFFNVAGVGFDARVAQEVNRMSSFNAGSLAYVWAAMKLLPRLENPEIHMTVDGESMGDQKALLVAIGNCRYYGGGMMICPQARADDGLIDLCVAGDLGRLEVLKALGAAFRGSHVEMPKVSYHTVQNVVIKGPQQVPVHADGQVVGNLPVRFEVRPGALRFICR